MLGKSTPGIAGVQDIAGCRPSLPTSGNEREKQGERHAHHGEDGDRPDRIALDAIPLHDRAPHRPDLSPQ